jgi:hypothetical protein
VPGTLRDRRGTVWWTVTLAVLVAGAVVLVLALRAQTSPAVPRDAGAIDPPSSSPSASPSASPSGPASTASSAGDPSPRAASALGASRPLSITIPAIGLQSQVNPIGLAGDGSIAVPQPGPRLDEAAWFEKSPTPGQPGPSIIEGHVDSDSGPSVFYELGKVRPGQRILVDRADGRRVTFTVDAVRNYLKSSFPTRVVYGAEDLSTPALRLITCSKFDPTTRHHVGNAVVFAHLTHVSGRPEQPREHP